MVHKNLWSVPCIDSLFLGIEFVLFLYQLYYYPVLIIFCILIMSPVFALIAFNMSLLVFVTPLWGIVLQLIIEFINYGGMF